MRKTPERSFPSEGKEPVIKRIFRLVDRYPSRSAAARAWGINVATINNYYKREHLNIIPRRSQLLKIAEKEGVSVEWLVSGEGDHPSIPLIDKGQKKQNYKIKEKECIDDVDTKLSLLLSLLPISDKEALFNLLGRKGAEFSLILLDEDIQELHELEGARRALALSLKNFSDKDVREICGESGTEVDHSNLTDKKASA
ncbi:hypothetical protein H7402_000557 [Salmonella enterica]|nr:hypothetical protein [Salmonella enterica]